MAMKSQELDMKNKMGILYFVIGIMFCAYGIGCIYLSDVPLKSGFLVDNILLVADFLWGGILGCIMVIIGIFIILKKHVSFEIILITGYAMIYSSVAFIFSFIFNAAAKPYLQTSGRIYSFTIQGLSRLFHPGFSMEFFIPVFGVLVFIVLSIVFKKYLIERLKFEQLEE
jgi:hypothetical protein